MKQEKTAMVRCCDQVYALLDQANARNFGQVYDVCFGVVDAWKDFLNDSEYAYLLEMLNRWLDDYNSLVRSLQGLCMSSSCEYKEHQKAKLTYE